MPVSKKVWLSFLIREARRQVPAPRIRKEPMFCEAGTVCDARPQKLWSLTVRHRSGDGSNFTGPLSKPIPWYTPNTPVRGRGRRVSRLVAVALESPRRSEAKSVRRHSASAAVNYDLSLTHG
jgi:hypothetical protein